MRHARRPLRLLLPQPAKGAPSQERLNDCEITRSRLREKWTETVVPIASRVETGMQCHKKNPKQWCIPGEFCPIWGPCGSKQLQHFWEPCSAAAIHQQLCRLQAQAWRATHGHRHLEEPQQAPTPRSRLATVGTCRLQSGTFTGIRGPPTPKPPAASHGAAAYNLEHWRRAWTWTKHACTHRPARMPPRLLRSIWRRRRRARRPDWQACCSGRRREEPMPGDHGESGRRPGEELSPESPSPLETAATPEPDLTPATAVRDESASARGELNWIRQEQIAHCNKNYTYRAVQNQNICKFLKLTMVYWAPAMVLVAPPSRIGTSAQTATAAGANCALILPATCVLW
jgi:hypothetical protein